MGSKITPAAPRDPSALHVMLCSYTAASAATLIGFPLDTIKTRLQTQSYPSFVRCITETYNEGGLPSFYRGVIASLISNSVARAMSMSLYVKLKRAISKWAGKTDSDTFGPILTSGLISGSFSCAITGPFEFTKVASQVETLVYKSRGMNPPRQPGTLSAVKNLMRRGGIRQLYGGVEYHLARDSIGSAVYFTVYEYTKKAINKFLTPKNSAAPHPFSVVAGGGLCGIASWLVVFPIDTMKSKYQHDLYSRTLGTSLEYRETIVKRPPFVWSPSMYRGLGFSILRTSVSGMTLFSVYEYLIWLTAYRN